MRLVRSIGTRNWLSYRVQWARQRFTGRNREVWFTSPVVSHPLRVRVGTSDLASFLEVFADRDYSCVDDVAGVELVIDCGANVGYPAAYFLARFPGCSVIAVEPDAGNFEQLERNLAPFGSRVRTIRAALWKGPAALVIAEAKYRDGREWTRQVRECNRDEVASVPAVTLTDLVQSCVPARVAILKIDIEGAEAVVFADGCDPWIERVDNIVIELHDDSVFGQASSVFFTAIEGRGFTVTRRGDLTICRR